MYPLRYTISGHIFIGPEDDCDAVVDAMLASGYEEEFCVALDFNPLFAARMMQAGFLLMSADIDDDEGGSSQSIVLLPKLHLVRSALFFPELHIKKSVRPLLPRYELRFNTDFEAILDKCTAIHGEDWLTRPLVRIIKKLHRRFSRGITTADLFPAEPRPVSFGLYRDGELKAGEFGVLCGRVYTSYSGYYEEDNAGTVQIILMCRFMEDRGFAFLDLGMPLDYKTALGARDISPGEFTALFRAARGG